MSPARNSLHVIVRTFKAVVTTQCRRRGFSQFGCQSRFHDHIIRDEDDLNRIRQYIAANPENWPADEHYVEAARY
jgi:putative transposase